MFIGRERELEMLHKLYASNHFEFVVVYGRRRVGKTALLSHFIENKPGIYFMGVESNARQNLDNLSKSILEYTLGHGVNTSFATFQDALEYVFKLSLEQKIILVLDEYPYIARASKSLASTLQLLIDKYKDSSKLKLVLCGSSMSYIEDHVLSYKAPLYGRRTAQIKVQPFDFHEVCQCYPLFSAEEKAIAYGMVGGTPQYILQINDELSIEDNIKRVFLNPMSSLFEEPENLLKQEVREAAIYNAIITAIASGASRMSEISSKVGEETSICTAYLKNLINLGIVIKETPYGEKPSRKSIYSLADNMFRFWYRFIPRNSSMLARGAIDLAYSHIAPHINEYMGKVYEDICKQYIWHLLLTGQSPVDFADLGRWWGTNPQTRRQEEIDIMGADENDAIVLAECKWTNEKVDKGVVEKLMERSNLFHHKEKHLYVFSKNGFTQGCLEKAASDSNIHLLSFDEMMKSWM